MPAVPGSPGRAAVAALTATLALGALTGCGSTARVSGPAAPTTSPTSGGDPARALSPAPATAPAEGATAPAVDARACVARLPEDVRIGQTMLVTTYDLPRVTDWLRDGLIAGVLANGRLTADSAAAYRAATRDLAYGALLASDEEGGQVQRYAALVGSIPSARSQAATLTPRQVRALYRDLGHRLGAWGVDLVLAPVADVGFGPGIGSRAYSADPLVVGRYARAAARGLSDAGQIPVLKHFPGHGSASGDSHDGVVVGPDISRLRAVDLVPFEQILADQPSAAVMVGHTTIPGYAEQPSSQSRRAIAGLLRGELGFRGLVVSDALGMAASGEDDQGRALVGFLAAGGDLGIVGPYGSVQGRRAVRAALRSGELDERRVDEAAARVLGAKGVDPCAVTSGPTPDGEVTTVPSDPPVVNPTTQ